MKVLTVRQPWASLIIAGIKRVENRSWTTSYRGRLGIHAGRQMDSEGLTRFGYLVHGEMPRGVLLGTVELVDVLRGDPSEWAEPDAFHRVLENPRLFERPIPMVGHLGLWKWEPVQSC